MKNKFISIPIPDRIECGYCWWAPEDCPKVIKYIEKNNSGYESFALLKKVSTINYKGAKNGTSTESI